MPVVSECDDSFLSEPLSFPLSDEDVAAALDAAVGGPCRRGTSRGTGCTASASRAGSDGVPDPRRGGRRLHRRGAGAHELRGPRGAADRRGARRSSPPAPGGAGAGARVEGSCVVVVATDAPLLPHQLRRIAQRAGMGLARTGSYASNTSGEQMLAFSTANRLPRVPSAPVAEVRAVLDGVGEDPWLLSALFLATVEATEEAVVNALLAAETSVGRDGTRSRSCRGADARDPRAARRAAPVEPVPSSAPPRLRRIETEPSVGRGTTPEVARTSRTGSAARSSSAPCDRRVFRDRTSDAPAGPRDVHVPRRATWLALLAYAYVQGARAPSA